MPAAKQPGNRSRPPLSGYSVAAVLVALTAVGGTWCDVLVGAEVAASPVEAAVLVGLQWWLLASPLLWLVAAGLALRGLFQIHASREPLRGRILAIGIIAAFGVYLVCGLVAVAASGH